MTKNTPALKRYPLINTLTVILLFCPAIFLPRAISDGVIYGIKLAVFNVIPSVFPYLVASDAICALLGGDGVFSRAFAKIFKTSKNALTVFIIGAVCGFPLGVKVASDQYRDGAIKKEDVEHLIGFSCNPGIAFAIGGIGTGILGSFKSGLALYLSVVFSALICGFLFKPKCNIYSNTHDISRQNFDFVASIKNAGACSVTISSYIIFFSAVLGLIKHVFKNSLITLFFAIALEVSNGIKYVTGTNALPSDFILPTVAFALAFSGLSVHLQARSLTPKEISFKKFYLMKFFQGIICAVFVYLIQ